ncbi:MAG: redoxin domain-containing protein [Flavobacteriales bacterium]
MPKLREPLTKLAAILAITALVLLAMGSLPIAALLLCAAYGALCIEFRTHTGTPQFISMLMVGALLGMMIDLHHGLFPLVTSASLLSAGATVLRQAYMQKLTYVRFLVIEPMLMTAAIACQVVAMCAVPFAWDLWLLPALPMVAACVLVVNYAYDGVLLKSSARFGYRIQVGQPAPAIELPDQFGSMVKLSSYRGDHPVLLIFVRGDWCPGCHMMLRTYERNRETFLRKGVHVLAIGPDSIEVNKDMVERLGVGYKLLSDHEQRVSRQFGVVYNNPLIEQNVDYTQGIPLPASFLVDREGIVRYVSRPDRVGEFLNPELIFGVLNSMPDSPGAQWEQKRA